ncbi:mRNA capping enzyme-domain-containing protein [Russula earlei]|uniref:mRNA capping enzyme-domain-containing protein n=1 Tax=Russula earlei TaxID=71964 RepID=A0ACC0UHS3_9AGAM|nr:mRNA capping enzyme-domain-containing protein [Russula earlei]
MPGFDPVRDAVLNSPVTRSPTLPRHHPPPSTPAGTIPHNTTAPTAQAPRRATVAALLNDISPLSPSSSFHPPHPPPVTRVRSPTPQRPLSPPPPPKPKPLPYNPRRKTPAGSVLEPLTQDEMYFFRTQPGTGTRRLSKRKRSPSYELPDNQPAAKKTRDAGLVMNHYNARPEIGIDQRRVSRIIGLRNFNNWIKSVLITRFAHPALELSTVVDGHGGRAGTGGLRGKVLDLGCGKGGDLNKWSKARIKEYVALDVAAVSIDQARTRWESLSRGTRFDATFAVLDCYSEPLARGIPRAKLAQPFDVVSMQFCMHYAFESEAKVRCMLENVSTYLRRGGIFVGTIPNAEQLLLRLDQIPAIAPELSFGNSVYSIKFESREPRPLYGHRYSFFLQDAVEDVPEYIVRWSHFIQIAAEFGLHPLYRKEFHEVFEEFQEHHEFKPLLQRMNVVDANGETEMDDDQWEAANIYVAFAMEKR